MKQLQEANLNLDFLIKSFYSKFLIKRNPEANLDS